MTEELTKICYKCKEAHPISIFAKDKTKPDGLQAKCKPCVKAYNIKNKDRQATQKAEYNEIHKEDIKIKKKKYHENNKESISKKGKIYYENNRESRLNYSIEYRKSNPDKIKELSVAYYENNKDALLEKSKLYYEDNKDIILSYLAEYRKSNPDKIKELSVAYYENNKDAIIAQHNEYTKAKRNSDPLYALILRIRSGVSQSFRKSGLRKSSKTATILGCSFEEFYAHIESQFTDGMSWDNRELWHIDHIVPVSFGISEEEILLLNHHSNFRPLWATENLEKYDKLTEESLNHPIYLQIIQQRCP